MPPKFEKLQKGERRIKHYGWNPDLPDHRDLLYAVPPPTAMALPPSADLRPDCPPVYDQGQLGSCTGNAIAGAIQFEQIKAKLPSFTPSRLFIYYNERVIEHDVQLDHGAQIRDGIKSVATQGVCSESSWPYSDQNKDPDPCPDCPYAKKPPQSCFDEAKQHTVKLYQRLTPVLNTLKGCLADGYPFVFGFTVYQSFESEAVASTGIVPMPASSEAVVGGHAVVAVGYDDSSQCFIVRNSWGAGWGLKGYFMMPYGYLTNPNLADDFWTIRTLG
ncbi:MAG TPA: C1 family peptidase [Candidatus Saccharimonadales bacterium]|jgi:C1A family cysteine protease|nr:C1 family peptidase [Candidatus Saccharimonadales bacterium]